MSVFDRKSERIENLTSDGTESIEMFDISSTGACCVHGEPLEKGSFVAAQINDLVLRARVAYCQERSEGFRVGLEFWNVSADKRKMLEEFVDGYSRGVPVTCKILRTEDVKDSERKDKK